MGIQLKTEDLWVRIGDTEILKGINLDAQQGEILSIIGPAGAGKTTSHVVYMPRSVVEEVGTLPIPIQQPATTRLLGEEIETLPMATPARSVAGLRTEPAGCRVS